MRVERSGELVVRWRGGEDGDGGGQGPVVVLFHGYGAPGDDLVPLARELSLASGAGAAGLIRFAFPEGLEALPQFGSASRAWWPIDMQALSRTVLAQDVGPLTREEPPTLERVVQVLAGWLSTVTAPKLVLGGFSQGAMVASHLAASLAARPCGLVLLSGALVASSRLTAAMADRGAPARVFQSHGSADPVLPLAAGQALREALERAGSVVEFHGFAGGHGIPGQLVERLVDYLERVLREPEVPVGTEPAEAPTP